MCTIAYYHRPWFLMVFLLAWQVGRAFTTIAEGRGSNPLSGQVKEWKIGTCWLPG